VGFGRRRPGASRRLHGRKFAGDDGLLDSEHRFAKGKHHGVEELTASSPRRFSRRGLTSGKTCRADPRTRTPCDVRRYRTGYWDRERTWEGARKLRLLAAKPGTRFVGDLRAAGDVHHGGKRDLLYDGI
jgi:hypothetical protein